MNILGFCRVAIESKRSDSGSVLYKKKIRVVIFTMFSHRKVLLNWQTVRVFIMNGFFIVLFLVTKLYHIIC